MEPLPQDDHGSSLLPADNEEPMMTEAESDQASDQDLGPARDDFWEVFSPPRIAPLWRQDGYSAPYSIDLLTGWDLSKRLVITHHVLRGKFWQPCAWKDQPPFIGPYEFFIVPRISAPQIGVWSLG